MPDTKRSKKQNGFTLLEVIMVTMIIGAILAMIIPRAYRARIDTKYELLRQTCTELASWANEWAERELETQPGTASSNLADYMDTLGDDGSVLIPPAGNLDRVFDWVAADPPLPGNMSNWQGDDVAHLEVVVGRDDGTGIDQPPRGSVREIMSKNKVLTNPFNGISVFSSSNLPTLNAITGAFGCAWINDGAAPDIYRYYALIFQGTDSDRNEFYAGQDRVDLQGLRNGIFINRLMP